MSAERTFIGVLVLAAAALALSPAAPSVAASSGVAARPACAPSPNPGVARCLLLVRTDIPQVKQSPATPRQAPVGYGYGPADLHSAYALPSATTGVGQTVAIVDAYHNPNIASDLATYRAAWGLPACDPSSGAGCVTEVNEHGSASPLPGDVHGGWGIEQSADVDMVSAICADCRILLVEANSASLYDLGAGVDAAVRLGAHIVSNSYGEELLPGQPPDNRDYNHPGVAVVAATGDSGYGDTNFPAASPYVIAVGGTTLKRASNARGWIETAWKEGSSGCSGSTEVKPAWQLDGGCGGRTVSDVAAVADQSTGVAIYDTYHYTGWDEGGGTSVAAPIIAGAYALAGSPAAGTYPSSYLYSHVGGLNDVTNGSNITGGCHVTYMCTAGPGYDGPTGWGTPEGLSSFTVNSPLVVGQISGGTANAKLGGLSTGWVGQSGGATRVAVAADPRYGPLIGVINGGNAYVKEGGLQAPWDEEMPNVTQLVLSSDSMRGPLIGVVSHGTAYVKQGSLTAPWVTEMTGVSQLAVANDASHNALIAVVTTSGKLYAKQGALDQNWVLLRTGAHLVSVASDSVNGPLIAVIADSGTYAKQGSLTAPWVLEDRADSQVAVASDPVHGPLIAVISSNDAAYAKEGGLTAGWVLQRPFALGLAVSSDADTGPVIATYHLGVMYAKQGSLHAPWIEQQSGGVTNFSVAG